MRELYVFLSLDSYSFASLLTEFNLPVPKLLFPFKNSFDGWYGELNKTISGHENLIFGWEDDKYGFPSHALHVTQTSSSIVKASGITDAIDVSSQFSVLFHLKFQFAPDSVTLCQFGDSNDDIKLTFVINQDKLEITYVFY